jgi:hypothetical protein
MRDAAGAEEALLAREGAVDELVDDDEVPRRQLLAQRADGGEREDLGAARALQRVDVGAVVQLEGGTRVAAAVARQEDHTASARAATARW